MSAGEVQVEIHLKKRLLGVQTAHVIAGEQRTVKINPTARLTVQPNISGAQISIDGEPIQNSALVDWRLWPARHEIVVSAAGHKSVERIVFLKPGEQFMWDAVLLPESTSGGADEVGALGVKGSYSSEISLALGGWAAASWLEDRTQQAGMVYPAYAWGFTW